MNLKAQISFRLAGSIKTWKVCILITYLRRKQKEVAFCTNDNDEKQVPLNPTCHSAVIKPRSKTNKEYKAKEKFFHFPTSSPLPLCNFTISWKKIMRGREGMKPLLCNAWKDILLQCLHKRVVWEPLTCSFHMALETFMNLQPVLRDPAMPFLTNAFLQRL